MLIHRSRVKMISFIIHFLKVNSQEVNILMVTLLLLIILL